MSGLKNASAVSVQNSTQFVNTTKISVTLIFTPSEVGLVGVPAGKLPKSIKVSENKVEEKTFKHFGLADYQQIKTRLQTEKSPFDAIKTSASDGGDLIAYLNPKTGKYVVYLNIEKKLYQALAKKATEINTETQAEKKTSKTDSNPNENFAGRTGIDQTTLQRNKFDKLLREAQILPSSFGLPTDLAELNHVVVTLPQGVSPNADSALSAYIEKRYGNSNLFGQDKLDILNSAKLSGVKVENLKVSANNSRVVEFDLSVESLLKLQKSYLDVQSKVNTDIAVAEKIKHEMALNQFLLGAMQGAWDDVKGTYNTITSPLQTIQQIREAIGILSQLSAEDLKNITAELGNKAVNATPGEAAYGAGYVVGTAAVEIILAKGTGAALSALGKTKVGAEFLARLGKLADKTGEIANLTKVKIAEKFSDEAASLASLRAKQKLASLTLYNGAAGADVLADLAIVAGNTLKNGTVKFTEFSAQMIKKCGDSVKPHLAKLHREGLISLDLLEAKQIISSSGKVIDDVIVKEAKEKVYDLVKNNRAAELDKYLDGIKNKYGADFLNELKETRTKYVESIYETSRRTIDTQDLLGGHIREEHVGRSEAWLRNRLNQPENSSLNFASSFKNEEIANRIIGKFVRQFERDIEKFLKNSKSLKLEVVFDTGEQSLGTGVTRRKSGVWDSTKAYVMIVKDNSEKGWHVLTSYPTLLKEGIR